MGTPVGTHSNLLGSSQCSASPLSFLNGHIPPKTSFKRTKVLSRRSKSGHQLLNRDKIGKSNGKSGQKLLSVEN